MVKVTARRNSRFEAFLRGTKTFKSAPEGRYSAFVSVAVLPLGLVPEMTYFSHRLLGHASIQTTERYLGTKQDLVQAVNDRMKIRVERE